MKFHHKVLIVVATATVSVGLTKLAPQTPFVPIPQQTPIVNNVICKPQDLATLQVLWQHIYHPQRLQVESPCDVVTGTVFTIIHEPDGDIHMRLTVDSQYQDWINPINVSGQHGKLVIEPICNPDGNTPITQADAIQPCGTFTYPLPIPKVGDHIKIVGSKVLDIQHHGWREIHPVLSFEQSPV